MTDPAPPANRQPAPDQGDDEPLGTPQRWVAGLVGVASGAAGAWATFLDGSNVGGAPLLIGVGAVFGYLALTGQRLTRLEAGGAKADLARTRRAIEVVAVDPQVPDETKAEIAEVIAEDRNALSPPALRALEGAVYARDVAFQYERGIRAAIQRVRPDLTVYESSLDGAADLIVSDGDREIPVVVKRVVHHDRLSATVFRLLDRSMPARPYLLVANVPLSDMKAEYWEKVQDRLVFAVWSETVGDGDLNEALTRLFGPPAPQAAATR